MRMHFTAAPGGTHRGPDHHAQEKETEGQGRPEFEIAGGITGGGGNGSYGEGGILQGFPKGVVRFPEAVEGDDEGEEQPKTHEKAALRIPPQGQGLAPEGLEVQGEVDAPQEHEDGHHHIDVNALVVADGGVLGGKAAGGQGAEGVAEGVQEIHAPQQQEDGFGHREGHINLPEDHGGVFEAGFELVHHGPGTSAL